MTRIALIEPCALVPSGTESPKRQSSNSDYLFHPISPDKEVQDDVSCISDESNADDVDMDFTPYPFAATEQELDDWQGLEFSFGQDWSQRLADQLSDTDMTPHDSDDLDSDDSSIASDEVSFFVSDDWCDIIPRDQWEQPVATA